MKAPFALRQRAYEMAEAEYFRDAKSSVENAASLPASCITLKFEANLCLCWRQMHPNLLTCKRINVIKSYELCRDEYNRNEQLKKQFVCTTTSKICAYNQAERHRRPHAILKCAVFNNEQKKLLPTHKSVDAMCTDGAVRKMKNSTHRLAARHVVCHLKKKKKTIVACYFRAAGQLPTASRTCCS